MALSSDPGWARHAVWPAPFIGFLYYFTRHYSPVYLVFGCAVLAAFSLLYFRWDKTGSAALGTAALAAVAAGLFGLGLWQFLNLRDPGDVDHASYACALWNMRHGNTRYSISDLDFFGVHSNYTGLLWIPIQALAGEWGLKIGKALCLMASALLAVRRFRGDRRIHAWGAAAILLSPPIASQFFNGFHLEFLAAPVLILLFDAYRREKLGAFLACTAFLAYSKEVFTLAVGGLLLVALIERRPWKWILAPGLLCCVQMALYWLVIQPHFAPQGNGLGYQMPVSPGQIIEMWSRPGNLLYLLHFLLPFLPLLIILPKRYLLIPLPLAIFYLAFPDPLFQSLWSHYPYPLSFLCAAGLALSRDLAPSASASTATATAPTITGSAPLGRVLMTCAAVSLLSYPVWRKSISVPKPDFERIREVARIHDRIPHTASMLLHVPFTARFAARKEASDWFFRIRPIGEFDFILMDTAFAPESHGSPDRLAADIRDLSASPDWSLESSRNGLYLFRNTRPVPAP